MTLRIVAFALVLPCVLLARTAAALEVPPLAGHVNDYAKLLPIDRVRTLEARLAEYERESKHQFALLTLPSLDGEAIEDFSIHVAERWKLGNKGKDDGLVLLIVPSERKMRIEVGYGLEGEIPDAIAARVIREVLAPAFRGGDYAGGVEAAFAVLMHVAGGGHEGTPAAYARHARRTPWAALPVLFPILLFFGITLLPMLLGGGYRRRGGYWGGWGGGFGGGFGGGYGGGFGGGGGGGGGGFSGGGGGFGGGGASGGW
jgi:uncharacterized protein